MTKILKTINGYIPKTMTDSTERPLIKIEVSKYWDPDYGYALTIAVGDQWGVFELTGSEPAEFLSAIESVGWGNVRSTTIDLNISGIVFVAKIKAKPLQVDGDLQHCMWASNRWNQSPLFLTELGWRELADAVGQYIMDNPVPIAAE